MKSIPCVALCVVCAGVGVMSFANPISVTSSSSSLSTLTSGGTTYTRTITPSSSGARWLQDTAAEASRGIGVNAFVAEPAVSHRNASVRTTVRVPDPLKGTAANDGLTDEYESQLGELYGKIRELDKDLLERYEASGAKEHVLFLCIPMDKKFLGFKTGRKVVVKRYSCGDGKDLWQVPNRIEDPDVGVFAWVDALRHRYYGPVDNLSFDGRKAIVLHAIYAE